MRAWVLHGANDFRYEEVEKPGLADGEVLVKVMAAGICGSDVPRIYRDGAHRHPLIPGHEFSGIVEECAPGTDAAWLGKRVGIFPLIPCGECLPCQKKQYELCRNYSYLGSRRDGGFAEYVAVPEWNLLALPDNVTYEEAAMLEPMAVAVHAMRRIELRQSDTVAVAGLGTIGLLLTVFLMEQGIQDIYVIGNKDFQKRNITGLGLPENHYCDSREEDVQKWLLQRTSDRGVDVFFECVGRNETVSWAIDLTASAGRVCLMGNPWSDMALDKAVYWKILRNQLTVTGTWNSSFTHETQDDWHYVLERLKEKRIAPAELITHRVPLEELEKGLAIMRDKSEDYVKIMCLPLAAS